MAAGSISLSSLTRDMSGASINDTPANKLGSKEFSEEIRPQYNSLNTTFLDPGQSLESFQGAYKQAYKSGHVPLSFEKLPAKQDGMPGVKAPLSKSEPGKPGEELKLCFTTKLNETVMDLRAGGKPELTMDECVRTLRFLAYAETGSSYNTWSDALSYLGSSPKFNASYKFQDVKRELENIVRQQKDQGGTGAAGFVSGNVKLPKIVGGTLHFESGEAAPEDQDQLLESIKSVSIVPQRKAAVLVKPQASESARVQIDNKLDITTFRLDPNTKARKYDLFTPGFKENGKFTVQVDTVLDAKVVDETVQKQMQSLHFACKVLKRDIPAKDDYKEGDFDSIDSARAAGKDTAWQRTEVNKQTVRYLEEVQYALEVKAGELKLPLYMDQLIPNR